MSPEQAECVIQHLHGSAESCDRHVEMGEWEGRKHSAAALQYFRDNAAAYRAAAAVLRAVSQPAVVALPPCDPDGLDVLAGYDGRAA
jgi:hypothetical protein